MANTTIWDNNETSKYELQCEIDVLFNAAWKKLNKLMIYS